VPNDPSRTLEIRAFEGLAVCLAAPLLVLALTHCGGRANDWHTASGGESVGGESSTARVDEWLRLLSQTLDASGFRAAAAEFVEAHTRWFASACHESQLRGEDNLLDYHPLSNLFVIVDAHMSDQQLALIALAAVVTECPLSLVSAPTSPAHRLALALGASALEEHDGSTDPALCAALSATTAERVRCRAPLSAPALSIARERGLHVFSDAPTVGRYELLHTLREQSVSVSYHRYGNLGLRGLGASDTT